MGATFMKLGRAPATLMTLSIGNLNFYWQSGSQRFANSKSRTRGRGQVRQRDGRWPAFAHDREHRANFFGLALVLRAQASDVLASVRVGVGAFEIIDDKRFSRDKNLDAFLWQCAIAFGEISNGSIGSVSRAQRDKN